MGRHLEFYPEITGPLFFSTAVVLLYACVVFWEGSMASLENIEATDV